MLCGMLQLCAAAAAAAETMPPLCDYNTPGIYVAPPCKWPSILPAQTRTSDIPPQSTLLKGITLLENATAIPNYGADTWYPAEDRHGNLYSGFDDGKVDNVSVGSACTRQGFEHYCNCSSSSVIWRGCHCHTNVRQGALKPGYRTSV